MKRGIVLTVVALAIAGPSLWFGAEVYIRGESVTGRVVDLHFGGTVNRPCAPTVAYEVGGDELQWESDVSTAPCEFEIGQAVELYYWPDRPDDPFLPSFSRLMLWPGLPLVLSCILLWLAVRAFRGRTGTGGPAAPP